MNLTHTQRLKRAIASRPELFPHGCTTTCTCEHDEDCPATEGGKCSCTPEMSLTTPKGSFRIDSQGNCTSLSDN